MENPDETVTTLLAIVNDDLSNVIVSDKDCPKCREICEWCPHSVQLSSSQGEKPVQKRDKSPKKSRHLSPKQGTENDLRPYHTTLPPSGFLRDFTPPFRHVVDSSEYMRQYKSAKLKEECFANHSNALDYYESRALPTTQIVLNPASALRKPMLTKSGTTNKDSVKSLSRNPSSRSCPEQFVLCSPTKIVTYDCSAVNVTNSHSKMLEEKSPKANIKKKERKKKLKATLDVSAQNFCVTSIKNNHSDSQKASYYSRPFQPSRLSHFPVECPTLDQEGKKSSTWRLSVSLPKQRHKNSPDADTSTNSGDLMYSLCGVADG